LQVFPDMAAAVSARTRSNFIPGMRELAEAWGGVLGA